MLHGSMQSASTGSKLHLGRRDSSKPVLVMAGPGAEQQIEGHALYLIRRILRMCCAAAWITQEPNN
jgi:hypothetical protein